MNILIFHRVVNNYINNVTGEINSREFDRIFFKISKFYQFDELKCLFSCPTARKIKLQRLLISFDDGYADNFEVALPILKKHGLTSTFFIASGYLNGGWMWNDGIIEAASKTQKTCLDLIKYGYNKYPLKTNVDKKKCIEDLLSKIKYLQQYKRTDLAKYILEVADVPEPTHLMMTSEQVKLMHQSGMEIGGHTVNHPILTTIDKVTARREINENKEYLESLIGEQLHSFAYPNGKLGKDYGLEHVALVKEAGYNCAVSTTWGRVNKNSDPFQLPRFTPWDRIPWKFMLRLLLQPCEKLDN